MDPDSGARREPEGPATVFIGLFAAFGPLDGRQRQVSPSHHDSLALPPPPKSSLSKSGIVRREIRHLPTAFSQWMELCPPGGPVHGGFAFVLTDFHVGVHPNAGAVPLSERPASR